MVAKGSLVRVDYEAWTEEGELFDTTKRDVAKANGKFDENVVYEPLPVLVGAGRVIPGFDEALQGADVGKEVDVTIPSEKAFGPRDPDRVDTIPLRDFQKQEVVPYPGLRLQHQGKMATVASVSAGRVRIDYNNPLAGKSLRYKFQVVEDIHEPQQKVRGFIEMAYGQGRAADFKVDAQGDVVSITLPDSCKYDQRWFVAKYRLVSDLRTYAGFRTTRFVEEYVTEEPRPTQTGAPEGETHTHADGTVHAGPAH
ncbi:MAG TPA: FKBP-type peptidyl-prolyl cis-trans isomerase [Candidatus Thermoplasmatota archaeon]|nr:FKBP-type peptidyl-prolyl cis-trans isomerase [Candidatus Thermoplasmatota archaeon]